MTHVERIAPTVKLNFRLQCKIQVYVFIVMYIYLIKKLEQSQNAVEGRNIGKKVMVKNSSPTSMRKHKKFRRNFTFQDQYYFSHAPLLNEIILIKTLGIVKVIPCFALVFKNLFGHLQIVS